MRLRYLEEGGSNLRFLAAVLHHAAPSPGKVVLEIGCGTGLFADALGAVSGARVIGTEQSFEAFQIASQRISAKYCPRGDIPSSEMFDAVYCKDVLPMIRDKTTLFSQIRQVLRQGSPFITYFPEEIDLGEKPLFSFFPESLAPSIASHLSRKRLESELLSVGFRNCKFERIHLGQIPIDHAYARRHRDGFFNNTAAPHFEHIREIRMNELEKFLDRLSKYGAKMMYGWERVLIVAR